MRIQTDTKIEIVRGVAQAPGLYSEAKDPDDATMNAPAVIEGKEFAPPIDAKPGDIFIIKVL